MVIDGRAYEGREARLPHGFWRAQLVVWAFLAVIGFCIRWAIFGNGEAAFMLTLALEPLAFALTSAAAALHGGYRARTRSFLPTLAVAVVLCVIAAALLSSLGYLLQQLFPAGTFRSLPVNQYRLGFIYYTGILSIWTLIYFGVGAELEAREASMSRMRAETRATRLELEHLQRQIEPHFLFNALNAVVAEIPDRPAIAEEMTRRLADYLRYSLDKRGRGTCRVSEEIEAAETYIRIQALRFDKKLEYQSCVDPVTLDIQIPHMTLQGLVENAIKHGMRADHERFLISIEVNCENDLLTLQVSNPGDLSTSTASKQGGGLTNLCRRLALYYPERHDFSLSQKQGMIIARVELRGGPATPLTYVGGTDQEAASPYRTGLITPHEH